MATVTVLYLVTLVTLVTLTLGQDEQPSGYEGELSLVGGTAPGTGTVFVYHDGRWGKICDDGWTLQAAHVVCKSLGYARALMGATKSHFGGQFAEYDFWLDDVRCYGHEQSLGDCDHDAWGRHNCKHDENAGVFCVPPIDGVLPLVRSLTNPTTTTTTTTTTEPPTTTTTTTTTPTPVNTARPSVTTVKKRNHNNRKNRNRNEIRSRVNEVTRDEDEVEARPNRGLSADGTHSRHYPRPYQVRLSNGRTVNEGIVEVEVDGHWGVICGDDWDLMASMVVCKQTGFGFAHTSMQDSFFGGLDKTKVFGSIRCDGDESTLAECYHEAADGEVLCSRGERIASVICQQDLPDLVPNATLVQESAYLQDRPMYYLQCALEENCAAQTAFTIRETYRDWHIHRRRLLRFSSSTWNFGTADFRPYISKQNWEWHLCHMHYHSMSVFAHYDILDMNNNQVAEGHKASFCLEDVQCIPDKQKTYQCKGFGDQGISVGCADDYLHDIDCQWVDITDVSPGNYIFKIHVNPEKQVAELDFNNNAVTCDLQYTGYDVIVTNCKIGRG